MGRDGPELHCCIAAGAQTPVMKNSLQPWTDARSKWSLQLHWKQEERLPRCPDFTSHSLPSLFCPARAACVQLIRAMGLTRVVRGEFPMTPNANPCTKCTGLNKKPANSAGGTRKPKSYFPGSSPGLLWNYFYEHKIDSMIILGKKKWLKLRLKLLAMVAWLSSLGWHQSK